MLLKRKLDVNLSLFIFEKKSVIICSLLNTCAVEN